MYLFSHRIKYLGLFFILLSVLFAYLYFWGGKPDVFNIKVFALVSVYLETRCFVFAQTNILDELAAILLITGIALITFSKERKELEYYNQLRIKALVKSLFFTLVLWILCFLLIYGMAIVLVSSLVFIIYLVSYNLLFRFYIFKEMKSIKKPYIL